MIWQANSVNMDWSAESIMNVKYWQSRTLYRIGKAGIMIL